MVSVIIFVFYLYLWTSVQLVVFAFIFAHFGKPEYICICLTNGIQIYLYVNPAEYCFICIRPKMLIQIYLYLSHTVIRDKKIPRHGHFTCIGLGTYSVQISRLSQFDYEETSQWWSCIAHWPIAVLRCLLECLLFYAFLFFLYSKESIAWSLENVW